MITGFSSKNTETRRLCNNVFKVLKEKKKGKSRIPHKEKYLPRMKTKIFLDVSDGNLDLQEEMKSKRIGICVGKYKKYKA